MWEYGTGTWGAGDYGCGSMRQEHVEETWDVGV